MGTAPAATSAAEPPLEPPALRSVAHGLRVTPWTAGEVSSLKANSGVAVLPTPTSPAPRNLAAGGGARGAGRPPSSRPPHPPRRPLSPRRAFTADGAPP